MSISIFANVKTVKLSTCIYSFCHNIIVVCLDGVIVWEGVEAVRISCQRAAVQPSSFQLSGMYHTIIMFRIAYIGMKFGKNQLFQNLEKCCNIRILRNLHDRRLRALGPLASTSLIMGGLSVIR